MDGKKVIFELLQDIIETGKDGLRKDVLHSGWVKMWTTRIRVQLKKIYGEGNKIISCIPLPANDVVSNETAKKMLSERIIMLENFLKQIQHNGISSFCPSKGGRVFIGHGRSNVWRDLKDFLQDRLKLEWDEFNREPVAGITTFERISDMLDNTKFAFLVMTAEDEIGDGFVQARQNVVHEIGLFQGRLGSMRAIILLEEGCTEFSNIVGLSQIRFPKGNIFACFENIRQVLEREGIIEK